MPEEEYVPDMARIQELRQKDARGELEPLEFLEFVEFLTHEARTDNQTGKRLQQEYREEHPERENRKQSE